MVWNEEEAQKFNLFGDLKHTKIAIYFGRRICQHWEQKTRNQGVHLIGGHTDNYGSGNAAIVAFSWLLYGVTHQDLTHGP